MKHILRSLKKMALPILLVLLLIIAQAVSDLALPDYTSKIVDVGISRGGVAAAAPGGPIDTAVQLKYILNAGAQMLGIALISMIAAILTTFFSAKIAASLGRDLRRDVFSKVVNFSKVELEKFSTASLITRSTNDIQQIQMLVVMLFRVVVYAPFMAVGGIVKVTTMNSSMAWIIAAAVAAIVTLVGILFSVAMPKFIKLQNLVDKLNLVSREILTGLPVIRAFSTERHEEGRFDNVNKELTRTSLFVNRTMTFMMPAMMFIMNIIGVTIVWVGAKNVNAGMMQVGDMMAFIQYTMQIVMSFFMLSMISIMLPRASVSFKRVAEVLSTDFTILDDKSPAQLKVVNQKGKALEFKNVSFKYPEAEEYVLENISFLAKPGETTAIIGSTGSGKSTLVNLIPRFFDVTEGEITVDGVNIKRVTQQQLRDLLGFIPQKGVLFSGTIESNIKFGNPSISDEQMIKAAQIAQAEEFINEKEEKYKTPVSQGGTNVSGGQRQRLAIARAIAKQPEIYVFDDSFSALDYKTDVTLRKALKEATQNSTVLIVAQRISTILTAEQIIVLSDGKVVGKGTHKALMKNCDVYREIAESQLSKEEIINEQ